MSLKHVILVVIKKAESTGYEITKQFEGPLGHFWTTSHQRVYRALATLYKDGWVDFTAVKQAGKPNKKVYRLTDTGDKKLNNWLRTPQKPTPVNRSFLVKLYAGKHAPISPLINELQIEYEKNAHQHKELVHIEKMFFPRPDELSREDCLQYLTLRSGITIIESLMRWSEEALMRLRALENT